MDETVHNLEDFLHELLPDWVLGPYSTPFPVRGRTASIHGQGRYENLGVRSIEGAPVGASPRMPDGSFGKGPATVVTAAQAKGSVSQA